MTDGFPYMPTEAAQLLAVALKDLFPRLMHPTSEAEAIAASKRVGALTGSAETYAGVCLFFAGIAGEGIRVNAARNGHAGAWFGLDDNGTHEPVIVDVGRCIVAASNYDLEIVKALVLIYATPEATEGGARFLTGLVANAIELHRRVCSGGAH